MIKKVKTATRKKAVLKRATVEKKQPKIFVMIPTYNEKENIQSLIEAIEGLHINNLHIVVVDDASPDGTGRRLDQLAKKRSFLHVVHRLHERGRGTAGIKGFKYALEQKADMIIEMDADFSHHPRYIPELLRTARHCDVVVGSRFIPGGKDLDRGWIRHSITKLANFYIRRVLKIANVCDCTSGYRLFRRPVLETIKMDNTISLGPSIVQELLYKATLRGFRIKEIPIVFVDRKEGKSTFDWRIMIQSFLMTLILKFLFSSLRRVEIHENKSKPVRKQ
ncbi:polyprenol monophosphomannose synthase [bacterium]|nr:polyprenol monophosphomannose synthase [bacterium]